MPRARIQSVRARRRIVLGIGCWVVCTGFVAGAWAHHPAGGRAGGGSWGLSGRRSSTDTQLSAAIGAWRVDEGAASGEVRSLRLGAELEVWPRSTLGLWVPMLWVAPDVESAELGLGNAIAAARILLGSTDPGRDVWLLSAELGLPTETVRLGLDPGPVGSFSPGVLYSLRFQSFVWQTQIGVAGDGRRAGFALELLGATRLSYGVLEPMAVGAGVLAETRLVTWCRQADDTFTCAAGRASEPTTRPGDTAARAELSWEAELGPAWALGAALRLPFTRRRDAEWASELVVVFTP